MKRNDLSRSLVVLEQHSTLVAVIEMGLKSWLIAGLVPGLARQPLKRQAADEDLLVTLLYRWRDEAIKAGSTIKRIAVAFEAGRDGFWLARWLRAHGIEAYVIHPNSVPVSREHRRAKSDRLDTALLMRALLGWLRGEPKHCSMAAIPSLAEEDAREPRARAPGGRANEHRQPSEGGDGSPRGAWLQRQALQGGAAAGEAVHRAGRGAAGEHAGRAAA